MLYHERSLQKKFLDIVIVEAKQDREWLNRMVLTSAEMQKKQSHG